LREKNIVQFGVVEKKLYCPNGFFFFWARRAVKTTIVPKFGSPAQKWGRAGLGKGGIG
jgi:hypothetical protein